MHVGWVICEAVYEAEVVRRYGLWLPCDCSVSGWGYFHWVRPDRPAVGLWVMELSPGSLQGATFLRRAVWRVLTGYAHALSPSLAIGDVLMATAVLRLSVPDVLETLWPAPIPGAEAAADIVAAPCLITSPVPATPRRRQVLYQQTGAWVVRPGSESWWEVIRRSGPVGILLWVMDTAQERTSPEDSTWRLQRHRAILERPGDRIERVLRKLRPGGL
ncbi:MAG: hypothetical protein NZ742_00130 [Acidobacteria bacterium]|nr:hypothetical protein [Acidobacteriota bacterium]MDW7983136.1 hypothetical protein [Acidobacteriota bacterium]